MGNFIPLVIPEASIRMKTMNPTSICTAEEVQEYKKIYFKEFKEVISDQEAEEQINRLVPFLIMIRYARVGGSNSDERTTLCATP